MLFKCIVFQVWFVKLSKCHRFHELLNRKFKGIFPVSHRSFVVVCLVWVFLVCFFFSLS